eukprot:1770671-Pyramimonas_sp.AAC.1
MHSWAVLGASWAVLGRFLGAAWAVFRSRKPENAVAPKPFEHLRKTIKRVPGGTHRVVLDHRGAILKPLGAVFGHFGACHPLIPTLGPSGSSLEVP